jgi:hypothetical protein
MSMVRSARHLGRHLIFLLIFMGVWTGTKIVINKEACLAGPGNTKLEEEMPKKPKKPKAK